MGAPLDSYPVPSRRPPVCLWLAVAGSLEADKQHLSRLLLISCSLQMLSLTAVVAGRGSAATLQPQLQQIKAGEGDGRFFYLTGCCGWMAIGREMHCDWRSEAREAEPELRLGRT